MSGMMTNDQAAMIAAAISEGAYSTQAIIGAAQKYAKALDAGLNPLLLSDDDDEDE